MPRSGSDAVKAALLNCGEKRETGAERTSTTAFAPAPSSKARKRSSECREWPMVRMVGVRFITVRHAPSLPQRGEGGTPDVAPPRRLGVPGGGNAAAAASPHPARREAASHGE